MTGLDHTPTADLLDQLVARTESAALRRAARDIELIARAMNTETINVEVVISLLHDFADTTPTALFDDIPRHPERH